MYAAGTLPLGVALRMAPIRSFIGRHRNSKRRGAAVRTSSQVASVSKSRVCSGLRERNTT